MSHAQQKRKIYNFTELDEQASLLEKKNKFFNNYLENGRLEINVIGRIF